MTPKLKEAVLPSDARLEACSDPRVLAAMAAMGRLAEVDAATGLKPTYEGRLEACGSDPRVLAAMAAMGRLAEVDAVLDLADS